LRPRHWVRSVNNGIVMQQPFDIGAGDRAPMDEADLQAFGEVQQHLNSASAQMCWQAARSMSSAALKTNYVQNEPNFA
jgi:hypothetical protein